MRRRVIFNFNRCCRTSHSSSSCDSKSKKGFPHKRPSTTTSTTTTTTATKFAKFFQVLLNRTRMLMLLLFSSESTSNWEAILFLDLNQPGAEAWLFQNNNHLGCWRSSRHETFEKSDCLCRQKAVGNGGVRLSAPTIIKTPCKKYP